MVTGADSEHPFAGFPVHLNAAAVHYETPRRSAGKDEVRILEGAASADARPGCSCGEGCARSVVV